MWSLCLCCYDWFVSWSRCDQVSIWDGMNVTLISGHLLLTLDRIQIRLGTRSEVINLQEPPVLWFTLLWSIMRGSIFGPEVRNSYNNKSKSTDSSSKLSVINGGAGAELQQRGSIKQQHMMTSLNKTFPAGAFHHCLFSCCIFPSPVLWSGHPW